MLKKRRFLAVNSSISRGAESKLQSETCTVPFGNQSDIQNGCSLPNIACEQEYKTCHYLKITKKNDKI